MKEPDINGYMYTWELVDWAQANLNIIISGIKSSGMNYSELPEEMISKMENLAVQSGIYPEFLPYLLSLSSVPEPIRLLWY